MVAQAGVADAIAAVAGADVAATIAVIVASWRAARTASYAAARAAARADCVPLRLIVALVAKGDIADAIAVVAIADVATPIAVIVVSRCAARTASDATAARAAAGRLRIRQADRAKHTGGGHR